VPRLKGIGVRRNQLNQFLDPLAPRFRSLDDLPELFRKRLDIGGAAQDRFQPRLGNGGQVRFPFPC
jgi:hypothetical protein